MRLALEGLPSLSAANPVLVAASPVIAAAASRDVVQAHLAEGLASWQRPAINSLQSWLTSCWQEASYSSPGLPILLSASQERLLWERIIARENPDLFDVAAAAELAREAARIIAEWRLPTDEALWNDHQDGRQFLAWLRAFKEQCRHEGWITHSDLFGTPPYAQAPIYFLGFDTISPALAALLPSLRQAKVYGSRKQRGSTSRAAAISCINFKEEIEAAARWARFSFEERQMRSLAVFVPDLRNHVDLVERTFRDVCYPAWGTRFSQRQDSVFHVARSRSLSEEPLIASALLLLSLARPRISHSDAAAILRCPFLTGANEERNERAFADLALRRMRELDYALRDIEYASRKCPLLTSVWMAVRRIVQSKPAIAEPAVWGEFFADLVQAAGWPGDLELTAAEQALVEIWNNSLSSLGALGMVAPPVSFETALNQLQRLLSVDAPGHGDWFSPIQILDSSDAIGLEFDAAFVTGLSEETWPPALRTNPFIPRKLLQASDVPHNTPENVQAERRRSTAALFSAARELQASYHGRLSPFVEQFVDRAAGAEPRWTGLVPLQSFRAVALDEVMDDCAPPFDVTRGVQGGTSIIRAQSLCPFRAFAEVRLRAQSADDACFGFDSRDRGGFLHKALQLVWQELKTQAALIHMPSEKLTALVRDAIGQAVRDDQSSEFHLQMTAIEQQRLEHLILDWLNTIEKKRPKSFTVETVEDQLEYELAGLPLRLRIDRVDRLPNGQILLIDYKSGKQSRGKLECPRPSEPQLLVYAAAKGDRVDGVFFGEVKPRDLRVVGFARDKYFNSKSITVKKGEWDDFADQSRAEVESLAGEFLAGNALVDPTRGACEYCGVKPFCRINEKASAREEEE